jgi:hypothetical protein
MILRRKPSQNEDMVPEYNVSEEHSVVSGVHQDSKWWNECASTNVNHHSKPARVTTSVRFHFDRYNSEVRGQDFAVDVEWSDVLIAIERFVKHGDRQAQCLQAVLLAYAEHSSGRQAHKKCDRPQKEREPGQKLPEGVLLSVG